MNIAFSAMAVIALVATPTDALQELGSSQEPAASGADSAPKKEPGQNAAEQPQTPGADARPDRRGRQFQRGWRGAGRRFGSRQQRGPGQRGIRWIERFDSNNDGKLTEDEMPGRAWSLLSRADADNDGALTKEEIGAMARARMREGTGRGPRRVGRGFGRPGRRGPAWGRGPMRGRWGMQPGFRGGPRGPQMRMGRPWPADRGRDTGPGQGPRLRRRVEELERQVEQLKQRIEALSTPAD